MFRFVKNIKIALKIFSLKDFFFQKTIFRKRVNGIERVLTHGEPIYEINVSFYSNDRDITSEIYKIFYGGVNNG